MPNTGSGVLLRGRGGSPDTQRQGRSLMAWAEREGMHLSFPSCCDEEIMTKAAQTMWWKCRPPLPPGSGIGNFGPQLMVLLGKFKRYGLAGRSMLLGLDFGSSKPLVLSTFLFLLLDCGLRHCPPASAPLPCCCWLPCFLAIMDSGTISQ